MLHTSSLIFFQIILVISSPSSSTTGFFTTILLLAAVAKSRDCGPLNATFLIDLDNGLAEHRPVNERRVINVIVDVVWN